MTVLERIGMLALHRLDPETAHGLALAALRNGLVPLHGPRSSPRLRTRVAGLDLPNPLGLAAGFDKNALALAPLARSGFGFVEVGGVTPRPQTGNPRPRLHRLRKERGVINRFGLNNEGAEVIALRLADRPKGTVTGLNLGANWDSAERARDYVDVLRTCGPHIDFATVNVSSPNTDNLRDLQGRAALWGVLTGVMDMRGALERPIPIFLKIAPDLSDADLADIAEVARDSSIDAIVATNTTTSRTGVRGAARHEKGGLSGQPLFEASTRVLAKLSKLTAGRIPLIGVGGVGSAAQAYDKIKAGASAVQLYSALVFEGMSLVPRLVDGLEELLDRDGFASVADAVGCERGKWL